MVTVHCTAPTRSEENEPGTRRTSNAHNPFRTSSYVREVSPGARGKDASMRQRKKKRRSRINWSIEPKEQEGKTADASTCSGQNLSFQRANYQQLK